MYVERDVFVGKFEKLCEVLEEVNGKMRLLIDRVIGKFMLQGCKKE